MIFIVLSFLIGAGFIFFPIFISRALSKKWMLEKRLFWRAGFYFLLIEFFYLAVMGNLTSLWPAFADSDPLVIALVMGISSGLFFELGRFLVLDKLMKQIRTFKEALFFGFGWRGIEILILGVMLLVSSVGMNYVATMDVNKALPDAGTQELVQLRSLKVEAAKMINGNPLDAFTPLVQHTAYLAMDLMLSLLVILALIKGETKFVWQAVGLRSGIFFSTIMLSYYNQWLADFMLLAMCGLLLFAFHHLKKQFPKTVQKHEPAE
ncbi:YhfC family intramembrane metalloprotease [Candidatus Gracilibacteria bacterium]|nr:YhfC family intramembrane metalloprotease [Candidatus Gracilibacteria bacterium]